jgi:murein DD-endopeptidase MepM/ murein hydrolase activator NlpD
MRGGGSGISVLSRCVRKSTLVLIRCSVLSACVGHIPPPILSRYGTTRTVSAIGIRSVPHAGVDIAADVGQIVIASCDGTVTNVSSSEEYGISVTLRHDSLDPEGRGAMWTKYVHLRFSVATLGQHVKRGDPLGEVGLFAASGGVSHVHWMLCLDYQCTSTVDPLRFRVVCYGVKEPRMLLTYPVRC